VWAELENPLWEVLQHQDLSAQHRLGRPLAAAVRMVGELQLAVSKENGRFPNGGRIKLAISEFPGTIIKWQAGSGAGRSLFHGQETEQGRLAAERRLREKLD
jgi:hypothetical protein